MKKNQLMKWILAIAATCLSVVLPVSAATSLKANQAPVYDFAYDIDGDREVSPVQVFDDGHVTYLQFRRPDLLPAIFAETLAGKVMLKPQQDLPYVVIGGVEARLTLQFGGKTATVRHRGAGNTDALAFGAAQPFRFGARAPTPLNPEQVRQAHADASAAALHPAKEVDPLPARTAATSAPGKTQEKASDDLEKTATWVIEEKDVYARQVFHRWAKAAGWRFSWEAPKDIPVSADSFTGTFEAAIKRAMRSFAAADAQVVGCLYENKRFRVVSSTTPCDAQSPEAN